MKLTGETQSAALTKTAEGDFVDVTVRIPVARTRPRADDATTTDRDAVLKLKTKQAATIEVSNGK